MDGFFDNPDNGLVRVNVSIAMMYQEFHPCSIAFVTNVCKGYCCEGAKGISITVMPGQEQARIEDLGGVVDGGLLLPDARGLCPFKSDNGLCTIHEQKPFGCRSSPFTLTSRSTLIVRNRYRVLLCYGCVNSVPAYKAHHWSLLQIFGEVETSRLTDSIEYGHKRGLKSVPAWMRRYVYDIFKVGIDTRHKTRYIPSNTRKANSPNRENLAHLDTIDGTGL